MHTQEHDLQDMSYVFVDLTRFRKKETELDTLQDKWIYFLKNWQGNEVPHSIQEQELIEAYHVIEKFNWSQLEMDAYVRGLKPNGTKTYAKHYLAQQPCHYLVI